jgi:hypothetical protein
MTSVIKQYKSFLFLTIFAMVAPAQNALVSANKSTVADFNKSVEAYVKLREDLDNRLPKLPKKATPEQIEAHKTALLRSVQQARAGARQGYIFTPAASELIRAVIKTEFKGRDRRELRSAVFEAETKGVPVRVNAAYPEAKELVEMPPSLLLALPQLPKQLRYRFVGTNLLLVDRENNLIVDHMPRALP